MTRAEMIQRLDAGENPIYIAFEKWERLTKWLSEHRKSHVMYIVYKMEFRASTCALCYKRVNKAKILIECGLCPIAIYHIRCPHPLSKWYKFIEKLQGFMNGTESIDDLIEAAVQVREMLRTIKDLENKKRKINF